VDVLGNNYRSDVSGPDLPVQQPKYASFWAGSGVPNKEWRLDGAHTDTTYYVYHGITGVLISIDRLKNADSIPGQNRYEHRTTHNYYDGQAQLDSTSYVVDTIPFSNGHQFTDYLAIEQYRYDALDRRVWMRNIRGANCIKQDKSSGCRNNLRRTIWDGEQILYEIQVLGDSSSGFLESDTYKVAPYFGTIAYTHGLGIDAPLALYKDNTGGMVTPRQDLSNKFIDGDCHPSACGQLQILWPEADGSSYTILGMQPNGPPSWYGSIIEAQQDASGFQYKRNRYYDPQAGRFTQEDPIGLAGGLNAYGFANGDPVNFDDPFGLCAGPSDIACQGTPRLPGAIISTVLSGIGGSIKKFWDAEGPAITRLSETRILGEFRKDLELISG
jgi:RHS repeat-associated protein